MNKYFDFNKLTIFKKCCCKTKLLDIIVAFKILTNFNSIYLFKIKKKIYNLFILKFLPA